MHRRLEVILSPVLRDIASTGEIPLQIVDERWLPAVQQEFSFAVREPSGSETRVVFAGTQELPQEIADAAGKLQEIAVEARWFDGKDVAWPECPDHPSNHSLEPAVVSSSPVWRCPLTREVIADIGSLAEAYHS